MRRFCHYLKGNKTMSRPRHMVFFDTETNTVKSTAEGDELTLKLYTAVYYRPGDKRQKPVEHWTDGVTQDSFVLWLLSHSQPKSCLYVFSANIWFDIRILNLFDLLKDADFKVRMCLSSGHVFLAKLTNDTRTIRFINIQNILPVSVAKLGSIIGIKKTEVDFDSCSDADLLEYCYNDTNIIFKAMLLWLDFITLHNLGSFGQTLASQAFAAYRHRFMNSRIAIHDNVKVLKLERAAYFGGRTECWSLGKLKTKKVYILDINSQYSFVMRDNVYPRVLKFQSASIAPDKAYALTSHYCIVARCRLDTDEPVYAKRGNNKTLFPVGRFETVLCTGSFRYAYEHNHIVSIEQSALYLNGKLFERWVNELYALRQKYMAEGNEVMKFLVKRILNTLYGKFGQRGDTILKEYDSPDYEFKNERYLDYDSNIWYREIQVGNHVKIVREKDVESMHSFPAIAAHVTDYARLYLWRLLKVAGLKNVYYMDTDSLYTNKAGYANLKDYIDETKLGSLALEKIAETVIIHGPKDYITDGKCKIKGINRLAKKIDENTYECTIFPGIRRDIQKGMPVNYVIEKRIKHLARNYTKGVVDRTGRVTPFSLVEF